MYPKSNYKINNPPNYYIAQWECTTLLVNQFSVKIIQLLLLILTIIY